MDARNVCSITSMRPVDSIFEFRQIIGRGAGPYEGEDDFTIYGFVKAHHHFGNPEWEGEPLAPEPKEIGTVFTGFRRPMYEPRSALEVGHGPSPNRSQLSDVVLWQRKRLESGDVTGYVR